MSFDRDPKQDDILFCSQFKTLHVHVEIEEVHLYESYVDFHSRHVPAVLEKVEEKILDMSHR